MPVKHGETHWLTSSVSESVVAVVNAEHDLRTICGRHPLTFDRNRLVHPSAYQVHSEYTVEK